MKVFTTLSKSKIIMKMFFPALIIFYFILTGFFAPEHVNSRNYCTMNRSRTTISITQLNNSNMDTIQIEKHTTLVHEVDINTTPNKIWEFLLNIDTNYKAWHADDHILFQWTEGEPFQAGSTFYAEQYMMQEKIKYKGRITECVPGEMITMRFSFPLSLITDKIEMIIEDHGSYSKFKHVTYLKFKFLSRTVFKKQNIKMIKDMDAHVRTEGGNMKRILEDKN
jgi:uncharacterized protein YndB with AHSA1/START domain